MLNRRLQVLVDEERYELLARESERTGAPVGELVRRAIDHEYPLAHRSAERERAGRELLAMPPPPGPEPDWEDQKREMLDERIRKWPGA
jgi:Ribbon-helix-helix protein, copG family